MPINLKFLNTLYKLYSDYHKKIALQSASEYIENIENIRLTNEEVEIFLNLAKHQKLIENYANDFIRTTFKKRVTNISAEFVFYMVIFLLNEQNMDIILQFCLKKNYFFLCELNATLIDSSKKIYLCQTAVKYFENDYALKQIVEPILNKANLIIKLGKAYLDLHTIKPIPITKPKEFNLARGIFHKPIPPANTPKHSKTFRAFKAPQSTWKKDYSLAKNLLKLKEVNKKKVEKLILEAAKMPERLTIQKPKIVNEKFEAKIVKQSLPAIVVNKDVVIKGNLTTTLREASRIVKQQNCEVEKIDNLIKGGFNEEEYNKLEKQLKKDKELIEIEAIERKHLKGLLSYEEAILAKKRLKEANKQKMEKFKQEKQNLQTILFEYQQQEESKIRQLIDKSNSIKAGAKDSHQKLIEKRQEEVKLQQKATKQMLELALVQQKKELQRKIELIQEIKAIDSVRCNIKEFDPTQTANLGLMCEMSIAELQERLVITKMQMKKELEEKRQGILKRKEAHRGMIEKVKKLVEENRNNSKKIVENNSNNMELIISPDIVELRKLLQEKRKLRSFMQ